MCTKPEISYLLYQLFKAKENMENQLDMIRSQLCQNLNFNLFSLFNQLDTHKKGKLGIQDILHFLLSNSLNATLQEIEIVLRYFTNEYFISLPSFMTTLTPKNMMKIEYELPNVEQSLMKFVFTLIDQFEQIKKISKQFEQIEQKNFDFSFGFSPQFTPNDLIRLYFEFDDKPIGNTFQIIFGSRSSLKLEQLKSNSNWKLIFKRKQARQSLCLYEKKTSFQRKNTIQSIIFSQNSSDNDSSLNPQSPKIRFCMDLDLDSFQRQTYLYN